MAASKTLTARESIEAAFAGLDKRKVTAKEISEHVAGNRKSKIVPATIATQLHRQSVKGTWIKRVAPGTYSLVAAKAPATVAGAEVKSGTVAGAEVNPDPKPESKRRGRKEEPVAA